MRKLPAIIPIILILGSSGNITDDAPHNCVREWWNIDAFIKADGNYSITASFEYEKETPASNFFFTIFNWDENKVYDLGSYGNNISLLKFGEGEEINLSYEKSWMRGKYPHYKAHFENEGVVVEIEIEAEAKMHFVAENEGAVLPMGFGYYIYSFIPKCRAKGWIFIDGEKKSFEGIAYYEHVWGNWSYNNPLRGSTIKPYINLTKWWWKNGGWREEKESFTISSDNPFGYDWAWIVFDNGWSMFYGAIPFWIREIPFGIAYLYNGEKTIEIGGITYEYMEGVFYGGTYIPRKIIVRANQLEIVMEMKYNPHIYEEDLKSNYWKRLILYECPGEVYGYYGNEELRGKCEIEIERQVSLFEYLLFSIYKNGFIFASTILGLIIKMELHLNPFSIYFSLSNIGENNSQNYGNNY